MPTIFRDGTTRVYFYSKEGPRAHVHVKMGSSKVKVWLDDLSTRNPVDMTKKQIRDSVALVARHRDEFQRAWDGYFQT